jgi:hypothetical protein
MMVKFGVPTFSLLSMKVETIESDKLPPDLARTTGVKPGSKDAFGGLSWTWVELGGDLDGWRQVIGKSSLLIGNR